MGTLMLQTKHSNPVGGIRMLTLTHNQWEDPSSPSGRISTTFSHYSSGSWSLDLQFRKIEDLQAIVNEARSLLDAWMVDELEAGAKASE